MKLDRNSPEHRRERPEMQRSRDVGLKEQRPHEPRDGEPAWIEEDPGGAKDEVKGIDP